jgi:histidinol-phosphate aminotransferase
MKTLNIEKLARNSIISMQAYSSARDEFQDNSEKMIFLDANENPYGDGLNRYPDPQQKKLKEEFAKLKSIPEKNIMFGNGSDELLDLVFRGFCEPNQDSVITLPPTYGMYGVLANLNGIKNKEVKLNAFYEPRINEILNAIDATTKIIFLCSPNNPTGNSFSEEGILEIVKNFNGLVVIDEAYIDFSAKKSWLLKIKEYPNLVIIQTLSKAYALAGIRLGILYADEKVISILSKIKPPYNVNELTQRTALKFISNPRKLKNEVKHIIVNRKILENGLKKISFVKEIFPSDANFILIRVDNAKKRYDQLLENGIVIRNRSNQQLCENCLRITVGTADENNKIVQILKKYDTKKSTLYRP